MQLPHCLREIKNSSDQVQIIGKNSQCISKTTLVEINGFGILISADWQFVVSDFTWSSV